jgi:hypothetical protein
MTEKERGRTMTREEAVDLANTNWWVELSAVEIVRFQLFEARLCMPIDVFHAAVETALRIPVFTHDFANPERLERRFLTMHGQTGAEGKLPARIAGGLVREGKEEEDDE